MLLSRSSIATHLLCTQAEAKQPEAKDDADGAKGGQGEENDEQNGDDKEESPGEVCVLAIITAMSHNFVLGIHNPHSCCHFDHLGSCFCPFLPAICFLPP